MRPKLRSEHRKILQAIFEKPVRANIAWADIESLVMYVVCSIAHIRGKKLIEAQWLLRAVFYRSRNGTMIEYKGYLSRIEFTVSTLALFPVSRFFTSKMA